ncbi:MAG: hypothetical protein ACC619_00255 [Paracoccaceae bacterium]
MKLLIFAGLLVFAAAGAGAQNAQNAEPGVAFYMGVGSWDCGRFIAALEGGTDVDRGQAAGWVLGFWSATTLYEDAAYNERLQGAGGRNIVDLTLQLCRDNPLGQVGALSNSLLQNSRTEN